MKNYILIVFSVPALVLTSCWEKCEDPDVSRINALYFEFERDGSGGFTDEELNSVFFVRYVPFSEPLLADTLIINGNFPEGFGKFIVNDFFPFRNIGAPYFVVYDYLIVEPTTGFVASIERIVIGGEYDGECGYTNTKRSFFFNGDSLDSAGLTNALIISR